MSAFPLRLLLASLLTTCSLLASHAEDTNVFGESTASEAAMIGIFYDLKQTQDHKASNVDAGSYFKVIDEFLSGGWNEAVLNRYYRVSTPLYTTQIYIPSISADAAPKAFGAAKTVKPSRWVIHYKAQVAPPEPGTYRFVGSADDVIAVAINGKTNLVAPLRNEPGKTFPLTNWNSSSPRGMRAGGGQFVNGDWVEIKKGQVIDLDVIVGERPGGVFSAFLMVEKQGATYQPGKGGPILPIFQVAPYETPDPKSEQQGPPFAKGTAPWKSYQ